MTEQQQGPASAGPPPGYRLKGPAHAHSDAPCGPDCYEPDVERHRQEHQGQRIWTAEEKAARGEDGAIYRECRWTDFAVRGETNGLHWHEVPRPPATPELDKQSQAIKDGAHTIGEFLDWLNNESPYWIAAQLGADEGDDRLYPAHVGPLELVAQFFKIDLDKIEAEKLALLDYLRELNS